MANSTLLQNSNEASSLFTLVKKAFSFSLPYKGRKYLSNKENPVDLDKYVNTLMVLLSASNNEVEVIDNFRVRDYKVPNGALAEAINVGEVRLFNSTTKSAKSFNRFKCESKDIMTPIECNNFIADFELMSGISITVNPISKNDIGLCDLPFAKASDGNLVHIGGDSISPVVSYLLQVDASEISSYLVTANYLNLTDEEIISELFKIG